QPDWSCVFEESFKSSPKNMCEVFKREWTCRGATVRRPEETKTFNLAKMIEVKFPMIPKFSTWTLSLSDWEFDTPIPSCISHQNDLTVLEPVTERCEIVKYEGIRGAVREPKNNETLSFVLEEENDYLDKDAVLSNFIIDNTEYFSYKWRDGFRSSQDRRNEATDASGKVEGFHIDGCSRHAIESGGTLSKQALNACNKLTMPGFTSSWFCLRAVLIIYVGSGFYVSFELGKFDIPTSYNEIWKLTKIAFTLPPTGIFLYGVEGVYIEDHICFYVDDTMSHKALFAADRNGDEKTGRRPDIMFVCMEDGKFYELMYVECSRITCTKQKEDDDVKLWRESNDGMYWAHKSRRLEKEQFGIIGIQTTVTTDSE
ncbi:32273_t:CDS:10, partial [Gigaspora margarita]